MTVMPQTPATSKVRAGAAANVKPMASAQMPLAAMAIMVSAVRPHRSEAQPPIQHPSAPMAMTRNVAALALSPT